MSNNQAINKPTLDASEMIDLDRFPINDLTSERGQNFLKDCHRRYRDEGLCLLNGFIRPEALDILAAETLSVAHHAYFCEDSHTAYLKSGDDVSADDHPTNLMEKTSVGSIAYDLLPQDGAMIQLYRWDPLKTFIAGVLGKETLHYFADPFGACSVNVFRDGGQHGWHFDESEFTVTLMLQQPDKGGDFEYVPLIRGLDDEHAQVQSTLEGTNENIHHLPFTPGTLSIFGGQQTIHRVTRISGETLRLVPVLCYSEQPGQTNSPEVRQLFWGRAEALS